jgi:stage V sporulation protein SpoVS
LQSARHKVAPVDTESAVEEKRLAEVTALVAHFLVQQVAAVAIIVGLMLLLKGQTMQVTITPSRITISVTHYTAPQQQQSTNTIRLV